MTEQKNDYGIVTQNETAVQGLYIFPQRLKTPIQKALSLSPKVYEIRLIADKSVYFYTSHGIRFVGSFGEVSFAPTENILVPSLSELEEITDRAIGFSGFLHEKEIKEGYITYGKSFRIGIASCGQTTKMSLGKINSLVIRVPYLDRADFGINIPKELNDIKTGLLIAGAPASGKTTLLREISLNISNGNLGEYKKISVIDERSEISGDLPLGFCVDVISGKEKADAIIHALRFLSPNYIICDEISTKKEAEAIIYGLNSGVKFICAIHAGSIRELIKRKQFLIMYYENVFDKIILLSKQKTGTIEGIYTSEEIEHEINRCSSHMLLHNNDGNYELFGREEENLLSEINLSVL